MNWEVLRGDCIKRMAEMEEASIDAVVTDPPYGLSREPDIGEVLKHWLAGDDYKHRGGGFMGQSWDSFVPGPATWREVFRVLKPGGHLLAFTGTRTADLMGISIRMAGFERRDSIASLAISEGDLLWMVGSGFPKSLDVSKAIDKAVGAEREDLGPGQWAHVKAGGTWNGEVYGEEPSNGEGPRASRPATPEAAQWKGWGTALKPAHEPIVVARKPLIGTVAENVLEHGTGGINIDACKVGVTGQRPNGRWPANLVLSHLEDCEPVGIKKIKSQNPLMRNDQTAEGGYQGGLKRKAGDSLGHADADGTETVEAWNCASGCPVAELDAQSGERRSPVGGSFQREMTSRGYQGGRLGQRRAENHAAVELEKPGYGDSGGASRFFYCAKASRAEREAGVSDPNGKTCICPERPDPDLSPPKAISEPTEVDGSDSSTIGSGNSATAQSLKASKSTTATGSKPTTGSKTSNSSAPSTTNGSTPSTTAEPLTGAGNETAPSAGSGSQPTLSTSTPTSEAGFSTDDADCAISAESSKTSSSVAGESSACPVCGGVIRGALRNSHPT